jgi:hypothetical protein
MQAKHSLVLFDEALNMAKSLCVSGHNLNYIELQLADKKYPDAVIDQVLVEISILKKARKQHTGSRKLVIGTTIIAVSGLITYYSFHSNSPIGMFMTGTAFIGITVFAKGFLELLDFD